MKNSWIKEILILYEETNKIPIKDIVEIIDIVFINSDIGSYKINENAKNILYNIEDIKKNLELQLKHNQWHQRAQIFYRNSNKNIDYIYIDFYNSFTRKSYYGKNSNLYITDYNLTLEQNVAQYINSKFFICFSKDEKSIFERYNKNLDEIENIKKYYELNNSKIKSIINPFYMEYINILSEKKETLKVYRI